MRKDSQQVKKHGESNRKGYKVREFYEEQEELASIEESSGPREDDEASLATSQL
jgi:hypothetical protein